MNNVKVGGYQKFMKLRTLLMLLKVHKPKNISIDWNNVIIRKPGVYSRISDVSGS